ncbi:MAG: hypothetical protein Q8M22_06425 [Actinomycetota bacterium]|nr:hypothetical protein [Actinomycetota bacterium]
MKLEIVIEESAARVSMWTGGRLSLSGDAAECSTDVTNALVATTYSDQPGRFDLVAPQFNEFLTCDFVLADADFIMDFRLSEVPEDACEVVEGDPRCILLSIAAGDFEVSGFILDLRD